MPRRAVWPAEPSTAPTASRTAGCIRSSQSGSATRPPWSARSGRNFNRLTDGITKFAGSMSFVYLHTVWFGVWVLVNLGLVGASLAFDKFPFGLLTMIVSL